MSVAKKDLPSAKVTTEQLRKMKAKGQKIAALTAYDFTMAEILDQAGIDLILVGDSAATVFAGYDTTLPVTMEEMLYHVRVVARGVKRALVVADMPFMSFQTSVEKALVNAGRFMKDSFAEGVKIEGGIERCDAIERIVSAGIPVMGHLGLTPQSIHKFGTYKTRGRNKGEAERILADARGLEEAGAFAIVLEKIPVALAGRVTESVSVPTIGIGAGPQCDGQILVSYDMLGLYDKFHPRFVRKYLEGSQLIRDAFEHYIRDVKAMDFPSDSESYS